MRVKDSKGLKMRCVTDEYMCKVCNTNRVGHKSNVVCGKNVSLYWLNR